MILAEICRTGKHLVTGLGSDAPRLSVTWEKAPTSLALAILYKLPRIQPPGMMDFEQTPPPHTVFSQLVGISNKVVLGA